MSDERPMRFEIRRVKNGVVLRLEPESPAEPPEEAVYQETEGNEIEAFAGFLRLLLEQYGPQTSRYSPQRIHVVIEPGDKFEPGNRS
jgi:hypothetical protein